MTVFVVTHGQYDNYSIQAIFSTRELAEAWINQTKNARTGIAGYKERMWDQFDIEEWELDSQ